MTEVEKRKIEAFDILRKISIATRQIREWQAEITQLESEINQLEVTDGST
jgi:peptidoglycan hydrolase CwlO-like protein